MQLAESQSSTRRSELAAPARSKAGGRVGRPSTLAWSAVAAAAVFAVNLLVDRYLFWDSYLDLAAGRQIVHHGIPHQEIFTVASQGRQWIDQQWLAHVIAYGSWVVGGYPGVAFVFSLAVALAFGVLCAAMISLGVHPQRAILWTGAAYVVCLGNTVIRAQVMAFPLFVLLLWGVFDDARQQRMRRSSLLVIPMLVVWANLHGSVLLAVMIVLAAALTRAVVSVRSGNSPLEYLCLALLAPLTIFATPYGFSVIHYYGALIGNPVVSRYIAEWAPPSFGNPLSTGFILMLLLTCGVLGYALGKGTRPPLVHVVVLAVTGLCAAQGLRYAVWFGMAAVMVNGPLLARSAPAPQPLPARVLRLAGGLVALFTVIALVTVATTSDAAFQRLQPDTAMAAAARYAAGHPGTTILADDTSSSALLWRYPSLDGRVAFDARLEQYPQDDLARWFRWLTVSGPDWRSVMAPYKVVVVSRQAHPDLARALQGLKGWRVLEQDASGVALVRT